MDYLDTPYLSQKFVEKEVDLLIEKPHFSKETHSTYLLNRLLDDEVWVEDYEVIEDSCSCSESEVEWDDNEFQEEVEEEFYEANEIKYLDDELEEEFYDRNMYEEEEHAHDDDNLLAEDDEWDEVEDYLEEDYSFDDQDVQEEEEYFEDWESVEDELNEWEESEDEELEEDFFGFGFSPSLLTSKVEFGDTILPTVKGPEFLGQEYYDPNNSGNPLLDTSAKNRKKKLSKNFSVAELAQSGSGRHKFYKARIDPELVVNLQKLRDFLVDKPIKIIDGYYSYKHLKNLSRKRKLKTIPKSPHLSGQGAKISVRGMEGMALAKAIVVACNSDVSISVGTSSVAMYVKQPESKITSYIGNKGRRRAARSYVNRFRKLHSNKHKRLEKELQNAYRELKVSIAHKINGYTGDIKFPWDRIGKAALYLRQEMKVNDKDLLTEILFYTKVFRTLRHHSSYDLTKKLNRTNAYDRIDTLRNFREGSMPKDALVRRVLLNTAVEPAFEIKAPTASQTEPLDRGSKGERVLAEPNPDSPAIYITGKYEAFFSKEDKNYQGVTLCINQAGNHVEGIISRVYRPGDNFNENRSYGEVYGELKPGGFFQMFYRNFKSKGDITFRPSGDKFIWEYRNYDKGYVNTISFKRTTSQPIMLAHAIAAFPKSEQSSIKAYEWMPLLSTQFRRLKLQLINNIDVIEKKLKKALKTGTRSYEKANQITAVRNLDRSFSELFDKSKIHSSDKERARFYILSLLVQKKLRVDGRRTQSFLDWIQFMIENLEQNNYFDRDLRYISSYLGLKPLKRKYGQKKHRYKVTINIKGATFIFGGYRGSIEVEKLKGTGPTWKERYKVTFGAGGASLTEFKKAISLDFTKSITAVGESYLEWQAHDFPGWIKIGEGSASLGPLGAEAGFIHIDGADYIPMMEAFFIEGPKLKDLISGKIDLSGKKPSLDLDSPYLDPKKIDIGFGGLIGKIHRKDLPNIDYSKAKVKKDFLASYHYEKKAHFALGSALLNGAAREAIRIMCAQELVAFSNSYSQIKIIAHTDRVDTDKRNMDLSEMRARNAKQAIKDVLGNKLNARFNPLDWKGESEAKDAPGDDENPIYRRVDIFLNTRLVLRLSAAG